MRGKGGRKILKVAVRDREMKEEGGGRREEARGKEAEGGGRRQEGGWRGEEG